MDSSRTILFAGGGTGGHIFPSLAIVERLREHDWPGRVHFAVSNRPLDARILTGQDLTFTPLEAQPLSIRPWHWPAFSRAWTASKSQVARLIQELNVGAVVAMGGFVSAPAVAGAREAKVPVALVNLDAVPGRANRLMAGRVTEIFSAYPWPAFPQAQLMGLPLRRSAVGPADVALARGELGVDLQRDLLLVMGGSQGAESLNQMMMELVLHAAPKKALRSWQVLHLAGDREVEAVRRAYAGAEVPAKVEAFRDNMGLAWRGASIAISRAGANSVAEAWANATPTIFMPYPYHKDQHQRLNAQPLARIGAAKILRDLIEPEANARQIAGPLQALMSNVQHRIHMAELMRQRMPADGAEMVANWLMRVTG